MEYRKFKDTLRVSLLGFGLMRLPTIDGKIDYEQGQKMVDLALKNGINYFDTAYMYHDGESQDFIGHALKKHPRNSYFITNKMPAWRVFTQSDVNKIFEDQLHRCNVKYFDFYLIHSVDQENMKLVKKYKIIEKLLDYKRAGKIRYLGFSFHDNFDTFKEFISLAPFDFVQIQFNYLDYDAMNARALYDYATSLNLPVVVMEPIRGGSLARLTPPILEYLKEKEYGGSPAALALRYVGSFNNILTVLSGMSTLEQMQDNINSFNNFHGLSKDEYALIEEIKTIYRKNNTVPCTACRYCTSYCPRQLPIPRLFEYYNQYMGDKNSWNLGKNIKALVEAEHPRNCLGCGVCSRNCPQHIDIREKLVEVRKLFDAYSDDKLD